MSQGTPRSVNRGHLTSVFSRQRPSVLTVNAACARALAFELLDVRRVEGIVRIALERAPGPAERGEVRPLPARFARPPASFTHPHPHEEGDDDAGDHA